MPYYCGGMMGAWGLLGALLSLLAIGAIIAGAVLLVRHYDRGTATTSGNAETILAERYARGDITHEEYQQRLTNLRGGR